MCAPYLKGFCMEKSVQNLDVNIVLSKKKFIGVAVFESTCIVGHTEISLFTCICLQLQKLFAKMGKCAVNAENFICDF